MTKLVPYLKQKGEQRTFVLCPPWLCTLPQVLGQP